MSAFYLRICIIHKRYYYSYIIYILYDGILLIVYRNTLRVSLHTTFLYSIFWKAELQIMLRILLIVVSYFILNDKAACHPPLRQMRKLSRAFSIKAVPTPSMDGELNKFFEAASKSGASKFKNMSAENRMEYTTRALALEEDIFDIRDRIGELEGKAIEGGKVDIDFIKQLREEMAALKQDYIDLVGSNDLPIYFGNVGSSIEQVPDSYQ